MFFASADALEDRLRALVQSSPELECVVLDCEGINFVDSQGASTLRDLILLCDEAGVVLRLARLKPAVRALLDRDGVIELLGADRIHGNVYRALEAQLGQ